MATYVYKYVHPDYPWLYVGKADSDVKDRVNAHRREDKFKPFLRKAKIYYIELENKAQSKFVESYLIDKYKPYINTTDKYEGESAFELNFLPEWKPLEEYTGNNTNSASIMKYNIPIGNDEISKLKSKIEQLNKNISEKNKYIQVLTYQIDFYRERYNYESKQSKHNFDLYLEASDKITELQKSIWDERLNSIIKKSSEEKISPEILSNKNFFGDFNEIMRDIEILQQQSLEKSSTKNKQYVNKNVAKKKKWWEFWK